MKGSEYKSLKIYAFVKMQSCPKFQSPIYGVRHDPQINVKGHDFCLRNAKKVM